MKETLASKYGIRDLGTYKNNSVKLLSFINSYSESSNKKHSCKVSGLPRDTLNKMIAKSFDLRRVISEIEQVSLEDDQELGLSVLRSSAVKQNNIKAAKTLLDRSDRKLEAKQRSGSLATKIGNSKILSDYGAEIALNEINKRTKQIEDEHKSSANNYLSSQMSSNEIKNYE